MVALCVLLDIDMQQNGVANIQIVPCWPYYCGLHCNHENEPRGSEVVQDALSQNPPDSEAVLMQMLVFIDAVANPAMHFLPVIISSVQRWMVFRYSSKPTQELFDQAALGPTFILQGR
jgi:hypothetical protein